MPPRTPAKRKASPNEAGPSDLAVAFGGEILTLQFLDTSETQRAKIRLLPAKLYPEFALALGDEVAELGMFLDWPKAEVERLHPASHRDALILGHKLNLDFFGEWVSRQKEMQARVDPGAEERVRGMVKEVAEGLVSRFLPSSPDSAPQPASPATPS